MLEMRQKIEEKRQLVMAKYNSDIQKQIKLLSSQTDDASVKQTEAQIETFKQKVRDLKAQGDKEREIK